MYCKWQQTYTRSVIVSQLQIQLSRLTAPFPNTWWTCMFSYSLTFCGSVGNCLIQSRRALKHDLQTKNSSSPSSKVEADVGLNPSFESVSPGRSWTQPYYTSGKFSKWRVNSYSKRPLLFTEGKPRLNQENLTRTLAKPKCEWIYWFLHSCLNCF